MNCILRKGISTIIVKYSRASLSLPQSRMVSCLVTRPDLPEVMFEMLKPHCTMDIWENATIMPRNELEKRIKGKTALVCTLSDGIDRDVLDCADSLRVIGTLSVGFDHIDIDECRKRGIAVGNTPDVLTDAVAELTVALLLATSRRLFQAERALRKGDWMCGWNHLFMCGVSIKDSVIGFVGTGRIGTAIMERILPFRPKQILYCGSGPKDSTDSYGAHYVTFAQLLQESDFVIVCCALTEKTHHMFNRSAFRMMKRTAIFINTSRGAVVDQKALCEALENGEIKAAGIDVMSPEPIPINDPLLALNNIVLLPHIGSASYETRIEMAKLTAKNVIASLEGSKLPAPVWQ